MSLTLSKAAEGIHGKVDSAGQFEGSYEVISRGSQVERGGAPAGEPYPPRPRVPGSVFGAAVEEVGARVACRWRARVAEGGGGGSAVAKMGAVGQRQSVVEGEGGPSMGRGGDAQGAYAATGLMGTTLDSAFATAADIAPVILVATVSTASGRAFWDRWA